MKTMLLKTRKNKHQERSSQTLKRRPVRLQQTILILIITILLSACGGQDARSTPEYFIAPTTAPKPATATPAATPTPDPAPTAEATRQ